MLYELLFFLLMFGAVAGYSLVMLKLASDVDANGITKLEEVLASAGAVQPDSLDAGVFTRFMVLVVISTLCLVILLAAINALFKGIVWTSLLHIPFTPSLYKRYLWVQSASS